MTPSHCVSLHGSREECRTAPDRLRTFDQADGLESQETTSPIATYYSTYCYLARKLTLILPSHTE